MNLFELPPSEPDALTKARRAYEEAIDVYEVLFASDDKTKEELKAALEKAVSARESMLAAERAATKR
jgi:diaminopimelate decarboxylase